MKTEAVGCVTGKVWRGVRYFCTTRSGGVSSGALASLNLARHVCDAPSCVDENRRRLAALLPADPVWLEQVHGVQVFDADGDKPCEPCPRADAAVTTRPDKVLAIMTADCLPVVISDADATVLGVAHAGWRGLAAGVLENTLAQLRAKHPGALGWRAWIGPAISQPHFEVGADVLKAFVQADPDCQTFFVDAGREGKWLADLPGLARHRLLKAGVDEVEASGYCSYARADLFYSYRRDAAGGRMATLAWLEGGGLR